MAVQQPATGGSNVLMYIAVALVAFGIGWFIGSNNVSPTAGDGPGAASIAADTEPGDFTDSDRIPVGDSHTFGNPNAPVKVVEFTSMQCPFCGRAAGTLKQLVENNPDDVQLVFKHFPLPMQQQAEPASRAIEAAGRQGKFWEMKDLLFDNLNRYREGDFEDLAAELAGDLGLNVDQFRADFNDSEIADRVKADQELGQRLGVRGTPHFFVNGEVVNGAQPLERFQEVVDRQLAQVNELREAGTAEGELYAAAVRANFSAPERPQAQEQQRPEEPATEVHMVEVQDHDYAKGASADEALVTIMEFSSFQCPFCARGADTLRQLVEKYPNEVRVVFKHFPLGFQEHSEPASRASVAAGQQGKFWEYYDLLYENQRRLGESGIFEELAGNLGLNMDRFRTDFASDETANVVRTAQREGQSAGIRGTPGFLVNGIKVVGAQPLPVFEGHVDSQIEIARKIRDEQNLSGEALYAAIVEHNKEELGSGAGAAAPQPQAEPEPERIADDALSVGNSFTKGPDDAPVTIYEFSSFQCPFCARGADTLRQVMEEYPTQVRLVFKNFPLGFQEHSEPAARASVAAGRQGKFWEMYDLLYENQRRLGESGIFEELAGQIGLNMDQFRTDFASEAVAAQVEAEAAEGRSVGVRGTPAFFINGINLSGAQPLDRFKAIIDAELEN